jgi:hypothetical protein
MNYDIVNRMINLCFPRFGGLFGKADRGTGSTASGKPEST